MVKTGVDVAEDTMSIESINLNVASTYDIRDDTSSAVSQPTKNGKEARTTPKDEANKKLTYLQVRC